MSDLQEVPELSWKRKASLERFRAGEGLALSVSHHSVCGGCGVGGQPSQEPWSESWPYTFLAEYSWVHLFISSHLCSFLEKWKKTQCTELPRDSEVLTQQGESLKDFACHSSDDTTKDLVLLYPMTASGWGFRAFIHVLGKCLPAGPTSCSA